VQASSEDHGQRFGLPEAVDSAARALEILAKSPVTQATLGRDTGDVVLEFGNDSRLEILTTSSGYEGWSIFFPNGDEAVGFGGGYTELRSDG
jgi:hypothetical protein